MTRSLILPSTNADLSFLPAWSAYSQKFAFLPGLRAWFDGLAGTVVRDADSRVSEWNARIGASRFTKASAYANAGAPLFVRNAYKDRNALRFTKAHLDAMVWSGQTETAAGAYTIAFIADLKPQAQGVQFIASDLTPTWRSINMTRDQFGGVDLAASAGSDGSVGTVQPIGALTNVGRPVLVVVVFDSFFNQVKLRVNNRPLTVTNGNPILSATDLFLGASGFFPDGSLGVDMDLYGMWLMRSDLLAAGNEGHDGNIRQYAADAYDII